MTPNDRTKDWIITAVCLAGLVLLALLLIASMVQAQTPAAPAGVVLSELDTLKAENLKLKAQVLELQRALAQAQLDQGTAVLNSERTKLEEQFRVVLKPKDGEVFDWQQMRFVPKPPAPPGPPTVK